MKSGPQRRLAAKGGRLAPRRIWPSFVKGNLGFPTPHLPRRLTGRREGRREGGKEERIV